MSREKFALVFWLEDPRSADVVLKSKIVPDARFPIILPKQERRVIWSDGEPYNARVIATGFKEDLMKLHVSRDGELVAACGPNMQFVTTRKRAIAAVESRASKNRLAAEDDLDQLVLVAANPGPAVRAEHSADDIAEVEAALTRLPCRKQPKDEEMNNYVEMGPKIFVLREDLHYILKKHKKRPVRMYRAVLTLLTKEVMEMGCLSASRRGTAKVPEDILKKSLSYTSLNSSGKDFDVGRTSTNLLARHRKKNQVVPAQEQRGSEEEDGNVP